MLILHIRKTFRPRSTEWLLALVMADWGVILLLAPETFAAPAYEVVRQWAGADAWGWACLAVGLIRLAALAINGAMRPSPHLRALLALACGLWWLQLSFGLVASGWADLALAAYPAAAIFDLLNVFHAIDDAGAVDRNARDRDSA